MITLNGKYTNAVIFTDTVEQEALDQIQTLIDTEVFTGSKVRIMPDVHGGKGCVIGFTAILAGNDICPNLVGVDIGCGVRVSTINNKSIDFATLDSYIRENIPSGFHIRADIHRSVVGTEFLYKLRDVCKRLDIDYDYAARSLGTLGGGNHFIEIDRASDGEQYLLIHTGSRNFGKCVAEYYQDCAEKIALRDERIVPKGLEYLYGFDALEYLDDMRFAQEYAEVNRYLINLDIAKYFNDYINFPFESVHNYIDFALKSYVLRKGAIAAYTDHTLVIPLNMRDGTIFGVGKGNKEWNYSAPHGAGRLMSRGKARKTLSLDEFKQSMDGIYTTSVSEYTLDEAPMAYKSFGTFDEIRDMLADTVNVLDIWKPVYNFKAEEKRK